MLKSRKSWQYSPDFDIKSYLVCLNYEYYENIGG